MTNEHLRAALYLRSSKDRHDVSIAAQRRELHKLATDRGILPVCEFVDVVESAKDENRPGFQQLLVDLKSKHRQWNCLLMVDTSRLSRRRYMAQVFKHECKKRDVKILYSKLPETDPIADMLVIGVMEVFDELHSLMSREKGLAGMAENVRQGYRAGGRAPYGYQLARIPTGQQRDGGDVTKSKLEPDANASMIARYLKLRAAGIGGTRAAQQLGLNLSRSTLTGIEWNALTYAGHTPWNVHNERLHGEGYKTGTRRKPRADWTVRRDTPPALITDAEAEAILSQLERNPHRNSRRTPSAYLLTGLLKTPSGAPWYGDGGKNYRTKPNGEPSRWVSMQAVDEAVIRQTIADMQAPKFVARLTAEARKLAASAAIDPAEDERRQLTVLNARINKLVDLIVESTAPGPLLRRVADLEHQRDRLVAEITRLERDHVRAGAAANITERDVRTMIAGLAAELRAMSRETLKDELAAIIERITLCPKTLSCCIHYRIGIENRNKDASPRVPGIIPVLRVLSRVFLAA